MATEQEHQQKQQLAQVKADIAMTERQLAGSIRKITPKVIERFTLLMRERLSDADPAMRRFYVNALVGRVEVGSQEIRISGNVRALENAVAANFGAPISKVRSIERKWCTRQDSNRWPLPSQGSALSSGATGAERRASSKGGGGAPEASCAGRRSAPADRLLGIR